MTLDRRHFLKISAATSAAVAVAGNVNAFASDSPTGEIAVWSTFGDQRHAKQGSLAWRPGATDSGSVINLDSSKTYQGVLGFGAAFTDAACFTLNRLEASARKKLFQTMFSPSEMGLSVSRICMGSSDYATKEYSYDEGLDPDPQLERFSIAHDREYILPILREVRAVSPEMWILASPWSPPAWMKPNKSMLGGCMRKSSLAPYAIYFEKFLDAYAAEGVRVNSVTPQNEIDTEQDGRMPACCWPQEYEIEFVRDDLGPRLAKSANPADIWILDHNYNLWGRVVDELEEPKVRSMVKGVAWHGYVGTPEQMMNVKRAFPEIDMFWTEGGPDWESGTYATEWAKWADTFTGILRNQARCIIAWNYALDEKGKPNIGPFNCAGLVTVDSRTREISYSGQYWAFQHFSGHIRRDAKVIDSAGANDDIKHLAARNPDGSYVAVLTNTGKEQKTVALSMARSSVPVNLPPDSITTLQWS
jgi:glucosylceramidase